LVPCPADSALPKGRAVLYPAELRCVFFWFPARLIRPCQKGRAVLYPAELRCVFFWFPARLIRPCQKGRKLFYPAGHPERGRNYRKCRHPWQPQCGHEKGLILQDVQSPWAARMAPQSLTHPEPCPQGPGVWAGDPAARHRVGQTPWRRPPVPVLRAHAAPD
jgi:hypothetical protein